jgi:hypothetical protein
LKSREKRERREGRKNLTRLSGFDRSPNPALSKMPLESSPF